MAISSQKQRRKADQPGPPPARSTPPASAPASLVNQEQKPTGQKPQIITARNEAATFAAAIMQSQVQMAFFLLEILYFFLCL